VGGLEDELLRAMVWGAFWDLIGEGRLRPGEFVDLALRELPREGDEQIAASLARRSALALRRYIPEGAPGAAALQARFEATMRRRMNDRALSYSQRKTSLDALLSGARTPDALGTLMDLLSGARTFDGQSLQQASRWAAVQTLVALGHPAADSVYAAERARDDSPEAARRAFVAGAAWPDADRKAEYFRRYFEEEDLNEEWVTASLGAFNHPAQSALTLPYLRPALDRLEWIRDNRRIFFLPQWVNAFIGGHSSREALEIVDGYLADNPGLPDDVRRKVLHARDALEEVVRVRAGAGGS
jgi:aminopeptidase N